MGLPADGIIRSSDFQKWVIEHVWADYEMDGVMLVVVGV